MARRQVAVADAGRGEAGGATAGTSAAEGRNEVSDLAQALERIAAALEKMAGRTADSPAVRVWPQRRIKCEDNDGNPCKVITSIRGDQISIRVEGGDQWAHITKEQAMQLAQWLIKASN